MYGSNSGVWYGRLNGSRSQMTPFAVSAASTAATACVGPTATHWCGQLSIATTTAPAATASRRVLDRLAARADREQGHVRPAGLALLPLHDLHDLRQPRAVRVLRPHRPAASSAPSSPALCPAIAATRESAGSRARGRWPGRRAARRRWTAPAPRSSASAAALSAAVASGGRCSTRRSDASGCPASAASRSHHANVSSTSGNTPHRSASMFRYCAPSPGNSSATVPCSASGASK